ncbi:hypothetical protein PHET_08511 [Paragonimus heterotremus]|uniref:Uncharacterized protein n=1 Tax=Paragonimus heterotremus TaxID=100268 RepID=A0A8J4WF82_9TREM|nr:hypothetical protein PHET_08511 [Paragonimus heterotremus]
MEHPVHRIDHAFESTKIIQFSLNSAAIQRPVSSFSDCVTQINRFFPDYHKMFDGLPHIPSNFFKKTSNSQDGFIDDKNSSHDPCRTRILSLRSCTKLLPGPSEDPIQDSLNLTVDSDRLTVSTRIPVLQEHTPKRRIRLDDTCNTSLETIDSRCPPNSRSPSPSKAFKNVRRSTPKSDPELDMHPRSHSWRKGQLSRTSVGSSCGRSSEMLPVCHAAEVPAGVNTIYMRSLIAESSTIADRETNNEVPSFVIKYLPSFLAHTEAIHVICSIRLSPQCNETLDDLLNQTVNQVT